ncbi:hypothetical protein AAVH_30481, partial [Aphelenchoides avenae]
TPPTSTASTATPIGSRLAGRLSFPAKDQTRSPAKHSEEEREPLVEEEQEYAEEAGGYDDEDEEEDEDEEQFADDVEVIAEADCEATFDEGYVSPLKAANPAPPVKCKVYVGYMHDRFRVWYEGEPLTAEPLFVHFIYRTTHFSRTNATVVEYSAPHSDTGVQKRVRLSFASPADAKKVLDAFVEGVQTAQENEVDEEEDFA